MLQDVLFCFCTLRSREERRKERDDPERERKPRREKDAHVHSYRERSHNQRNVCGLGYSPDDAKTRNQKSRRKRSTEAAYSSAAASSLVLVLRFLHCPAKSSPPLRLVDSLRLNSSSHSLSSSAIARFALSAEVAAGTGDCLIVTVEADEAGLEVGLLIDGD